MKCPSSALLLSVLLCHLNPAHGTVGKSTYAMTHPYAWKAWMEKYLPTAVNIEQENSTKTCNEWVKLCIDDGSVPFKCSGPQGNTQLHAVGAYKRDSGSKSLEDIEAAFTEAMGGMKKYDPWMELHVMFYTSDLDSYISAYEKDGIETFASTFVSNGKTYYSVLAQVDGSLRNGAGSMVLVDLVASSSELLAYRRLYHHPMPRASAASIAHGASLAAAAVLASSPPALTLLHISFPSANVTRDQQYFEDVLGGSKVSLESANGTTTFSGKLFSDDTVELRYSQSDQTTQGSMSVGAWEEYVTALHSSCIPTPNYDNQGFDRLADNHIGGHGGGIDLSSLIARQIAAKLPYRVYSPPGGGNGQHFLYVYGPNGWGYQLTGQVASKYTNNTVFYDMCTQGVTGHCRSDLPGL